MKNDRQGIRREVLLKLQPGRFSQRQRKQARRWVLRWRVEDRRLAESIRAAVRGYKNDGIAMAGTKIGGRGDATVYSRRQKEIA